jgi:hypothetical protein
MEAAQGANNQELPAVDFVPTSRAGQHLVCNGYKFRLKGESTKYRAM